MKRFVAVTGVVMVALTATACGAEESTGPSTTVVDTTTTTLATVPPSTTVVPTTTEPPRPVVTAVPVVMPIDRQVTTVPPTTVPPTAPPPAAPAAAAAANDNPAAAWTGSNDSGNTTPLQVGWIQMPKIGVNLTAWRAGDERSDVAVVNALNNGPTFWGTTTRPGEVGNVVMGGHRVSHGGFFRNIDQLAPGDEIIVAGLDGVPHTYLVEKTVITGPNDLWILDAREGATITLFACHPPGSIRQRIVVLGNLKA